jgi:hypothetical protein
MIVNQNLRAILRETLQAPELASCLERRLGSPPAERYAAMVRQLEATRFVVPVSGVQGSGKSTFLNAVAFPTPVLPVDADETTCVAVEIRYSEAPSEWAQVLFQDGRQERVRATEEALRPYVHNNANPGNQRGVDRIVVESGATCLRGGVVLVDLPGLGSLTPQNSATATAYLAEAAGMVFMLRTIPPMTASEATRAMAIWSRIPTAMFVQNRWNGTTDEEAMPAHDYNVRALADAAKRNRLPLDGEPEVVMVDAWLANKAALDQNEAEARESGIMQFRERLEQAAECWPLRIAANVHGAVMGDLGAAEDALDATEQSLTSGREEAERRIAEAKDQFERYYVDLEKRATQARGELEAFRQERRGQVDGWMTSARQELRNRMRTKMRAGVVDGPRLDQALRDEQDDAVDGAYAEHQEHLFAIRDRVQLKFQGVAGWNLEKPGARHMVQAPEKRKYENLAPQVLGSAAGIGGGAAAAFGGAKLGAAIGASGGPIGAVIGGAVGAIVGGLFGSWLGLKAKRAKVKARAEKIEAEVFAAIDRFTLDTRRDLLSNADRLCTELEALIAAWLLAQKQRYAAERDERVRALNLSREDREMALAAVRQDRALVQAWHARLSGAVS